MAAGTAFTPVLLVITAFCTATYQQKFNLQKEFERFQAEVGGEVSALQAADRARQEEILSLQREKRRQEEKIFSLERAMAGLTREVEEPAVMFTCAHQTAFNASYETVPYSRQPLKHRC